ncbi:MULTISPECIES: hypothetical protein [unclassified Kitasatospora]|uniref:hypothetical protein n=1 Tax=unclassified Kitasatospora TaxID=2633591 RepID=UPI002474FBFB|nr:hypothetical protein [Kitasatospora sp. MAP12-44]
MPPVTDFVNGAAGGLGAPRLSPAACAGTVVAAASRTTAQTVRSNRPPTPPS